MNVSLIGLQEAWERILRIKPSVLKKQPKKYSQLGLTKEQLYRLNPPTDMYTRIRKTPKGRWGK